jgi:hypothetical protein
LPNRHGCERDKFRKLSSCGRFHSRLTTREIRGGA